MKGVIAASSIKVIPVAEGCLEAAVWARVNHVLLLASLLPASPAGAKIRGRKAGQ